MNRVLSPQTNPTGLASGAGALFALVQWIWTATGHRGSVSPVVVAVAFSFVALITRFVVTPTKDPHDQIGRPLAPLPDPVAEPPSSQGGNTAGGKMASAGTPSTIVIPRQP